MAGNGRDPGRSVASKIFAIMGALGRSAQSYSAAELSRTTALPATTVLRLLREMEALNVVRRTAAGRYEIGLDVWRWGVRVPQIDLIRRAARPLMDDLQRATRENVTLAVLDGHGSAIAVEKVSGGQSWKVVGEMGAEVPLHATAAGKVLLAYSSPAEIRRVLARPLPRYTPFTVVNPSLLDKQLSEIRRTGVGYAGEEMNLGSVSIAAPIWLHGDVVGALSLVGHYRTADVKSLSVAVKKVTREISDNIAKQLAEEPMPPSGHLR
ncbi:IclR family transcriptional regulator [Microtetraspora sp. NBRC 16547]|uniref:IclR family transcriptional regulator n=1 Tax=Microtetraspora sp. NBRC 16547 TaxID=3030993 RepID=UPI0024A5E8E8|nr:IclR family transcriptional regulator [Microtetraspora sp. NBRC 16547]GLW99442.1 IclR family transcriptional regulator [Microtetraspora sp. NBRC 16547]